MTQKARVFVATPLDDDSQKSLQKVIKLLARKHWPVRWEPVEKLHLTIAFIGWLDKSKISIINQATRKAVESFQPFTVEYKGLGAFPDFVTPRVIWLGLKGDLYHLSNLYKNIRLALETVGFKLESRPFTPHITLGRVEKGVRRKFLQTIGSGIGKLHQLSISTPWRVDRVVVYESQLTRQGSIYYPLQEIILSSSGK